MAQIYFHCSSPAGLLLDRHGCTVQDLTEARERAACLVNTFISAPGPEDWRKVFDTNVIGFHQTIRACLDVLTPNAFVAALSSESVDQPRLALGAYAVSKVALERALFSWRLEHPALLFMP